MRPNRRLLVAALLGVILGGCVATPIQLPPPSNLGPESDAKGQLDMGTRCDGFIPAPPQPDGAAADQSSAGRDGGPGEAGFGEGGAADGGELGDLIHPEAGADATLEDTGAAPSFDGGGEDSQ